MNAMGVECIDVEKTEKKFQPKRRPNAGQSVWRKENHLAYVNSQLKKLKTGDSR
jgi:hypothetical protein